MGQGGVLSSKAPRVVRRIRKPHVQVSPGPPGRETVERKINKFVYDYWLQAKVTEGLAVVKVAAASIPPYPVVVVQLTGDGLSLYREGEQKAFEAIASQIFKLFPSVRVVTHPDFKGA